MRLYIGFLSNNGILGFFILFSSLEPKPMETRFPGYSEKNFPKPMKNP